MQYDDETNPYLDFFPFRKIKSFPKYHVDEKYEHDFDFESPDLDDRDGYWYENEYDLFEFQPFRLHYLCFHNQQ